MTSTICLNMIVKNETKVIARCLESVKSLIHYWVIVDTGSTDGTQAMIQSIMQSIPGELHERPWRNFGDNRTEALELARGKADYLLVIDADDMLLIPPQFIMPKLTKEVYSLPITYGDINHWRMQLFRSDLDFYYAGVLHEALVSREPRSHGYLQQPIYQCIPDGSRSSDADKYRKDAAILEAALLANPSCTRTAFYLAQSWRDAGEPEKAITAYTHRANMGGWEEEIYIALHEIGRLSARLGHDDAIVTAHFLKAYERRPTRAEPLYSLAVILRLRGRPAAAYPFACTANDIQRPNDVLFVDDSVYAWRALDEYAVAASWVGRYKEATMANQQLLKRKMLPEPERERIQKNLIFCREKMGSSTRLSHTP
ncbi:MAG: glycosyltransferase [Coxiellaceae bacterium]|nr:glycosyltransferase [Coxiellaceae bacterium]